MRGTTRSAVNLALGAGRDSVQNGVVDTKDIELTIMALGTKGGRFDMDGDGVVTESDLTIVAAQLGAESKKE